MRGGEDSSFRPISIKDKEKRMYYQNIEGDVRGKNSEVMRRPPSTKFGNINRFWKGNWVKMMNGILPQDSFLIWFLFFLCSKSYDLRIHLFCHVFWAFLYKLSNQICLSEESHWSDSPKSLQFIKSIQHHLDYFIIFSKDCPDAQSYSK